jgi:DNA repair exonuclease SbcCD ATPase subunit
MITLKELRWGNAFSYGAKNKINFADSPLTQLVGKNGHGKSSIALILEEVLYNKNSKGIKKGDILNRYTKEKSYFIELDFAKDAAEYTIKTVRGSTQTVKLFKGGEDISSHTATATYKLIEELLGIDHKAFAQIVYQSSASSLEFLTATDTNRKKFLIELLNLGRYTQIAELIKKDLDVLNKDIAVVEGKVSNVTSWLAKYNKMSKDDLTPMEIQEVPELPEVSVNLIATLNEKLNTLEVLNKKIAQNNTYKALQAKLTLLPLPPKPDESAEPLKLEVGKLQGEITACNAFVKKMRGLHGTCPTCLSGIDDHNVERMVSEKQEESDAASNKLAEISARMAAIEKAKSAWEAANKSQTEWEKYHNLIDTTLPEEPLEASDIEAEIKSHEAIVSSTKLVIKNAQKHNALAVAHNAKLGAISQQREEFEKELAEHQGKLDELNKRANVLNILAKTFSTNGLVAYKIESLVKDLEELTNQYLVDLSDGRFQIAFQVNSSDKLNVIITDNGNNIDILALSGGERARVNAATLLAIRKLMQSLSSSRINLLILDETVEALDLDGKEKLVDTLLKEESLNTYLVSHGYSHPLLEKVHIIKENNISRIES